MLVHYWAPWERNSRTQVTALDSLVRTLPAGGLQVAVVCFDPFPSVARYAARLHLRVPIMLDLRRAMQAALPCPSIPYTWLLDCRGRVIARQPGEVDWLAPETRELLMAAGRSGAADSTAGVSFARPGGRRGPNPPALRTTAQARAASVDERENKRASNAWPPNSTAL